jgi:hypothetical protein
MVFFASVLKMAALFPAFFMLFAFWDNGVSEF